ncbi:MAG: M23 family metallopeptidase [Clostridia bacterium]|nr:M23 family metallopeptidase [Clostridia bacterium]
MANRNRKNKGNGFLVAFLCLPLAVILCFTIYYSSLDSVDRVVLDTPGADEVNYDTQEDVDFFINMLKKSLPISSAMRDVSGEEAVDITLYTGDSPLEYKFYPSLNLSGCLLVGPEGDLFVLETETAKSLLLRTEFDYLYSSYFLPTLSVVSGENVYEVAPMECVWNYYKTDDNKYSYTPQKFATGEETYIIKKGFENKLQFTPDSEVRPYEMTDISYIADNGSEYTITDISQLDLSFDTRLSVSFTAKWSSMNGAKASGEAKYKFNILYDIPAEIEPLTKHEYKAGDIIVLNASHINPDEEIILDTLLGVPELKFGMTDKAKGVALIPISRDTASGEYTLNITTAGETILSERINVTAIENETWTPISVSEEDYNAMLSTDKMTNFKSALDAITLNRPETDHYNFAVGTFNYPAGKKTPTFTFGQEINFGTTSSSGESYKRICEGVVFEAAEGTNVRSAQAGEVIFSGKLAPTGNTVILYHGYGLYTYYYHLEEATVQSGDIISDGGIIGKVGSTGFTNGKTALHFAVSIDNTFINPMNFYN